MCKSALLFFQSTAEETARSSFFCIIYNKAKWTAIAFGKIYFSVIIWPSKVSFYVPQMRDVEVSIELNRI